MQIISQAEARAHRLGQENQVVVRYLLAPGTADDSIWPILQEKQRTLAQVGLNKDNFEDVTIKKQDTSLITEGIDFNITNLSQGKEDIRLYFSPEKKIKLDKDNVVDDKMTNNGLQNLEDIFNDGLNDALCDIDF